MRKLLPHNIALLERLATLPLAIGLAPPKALGEREIGGERELVTWLSSFATCMYVAIVAKAHPERMVDMHAAYHQGG